MDGGQGEFQGEAPTGIAGASLLDCIALARILEQAADRTHFIRVSGSPSKTSLN
jgi:hypothetical protein